MAKSSSKPARRAVIVDGMRTPFVRAFAEYLEMDTIELGKAATAALLEKTNLDRGLIDAIVWGGVILPQGSPNVGREIGRADGELLRRQDAADRERSEIVYRHGAPPFP